MTMTTLLVGTYTQNTESDGIYRIRDNQVLLAARCENPSFLARHPNGDVVYAVSETADFQSLDSNPDSRTGAVTAFFQQANGQLTAMNSQPSMGADPCHLTVASNGAFLVVSNYSGGTFTSFPLDADGHLEQFISLTQHTGSSTNKERQASAHVHSSILINNETELLVADLGADQVVRYQLSPEGQVSTGERQAYAAEAGSGPRLFAARGNSVYVLNELNNTISELDIDNLSVRSVRSTLSDSIDESIAAHVEVSADGRFLYASNRGHDSIAVFDLSANMACIQIEKTGPHPRHFALTPDGSHLYVACMQSDEIQIFRRDEKSGKLSFTGDTHKVPQPVCLVFV